MSYFVLCFHSQKDDDEIVDYFKKKYSDSTAVVDSYGVGEGMSDEITQQGYLPGVK